MGGAEIGRAACSATLSQHSTANLRHQSEANPTMLRLGASTVAQPCKRSLTAMPAAATQPSNTAAASPTRCRLPAAPARLPLPLSGNTAAAASTTCRRCPGRNRCCRLLYPLPPLPQSGNTAAATLNCCHSPACSCCCWLPCPDRCRCLAHNRICCP